MVTPLVVVVVVVPLVVVVVVVVPLTVWNVNKEDNNTSKIVFLKIDISFSLKRNINSRSLTCLLHLTSFLANYPVKAATL